MSGLDGKKGAEIREALIQFGKNIKSDVSRTAPFDKNVNGRVIEITPNGYTVEIQTRKYPNVKAINAQNLQVNDIVACCIPNNQMSQVYILGKLVGNITVSSGSGTITDVKVNGISVVTSGVANIIADTTVTSGSNNLVTSGAVASAISGIVVPTSINGMSGGSLTSPLVISGGDATTASKIALSRAQAGQITDEATSTLFGWLSNNATTLTVGSNSYGLNLRGNTTRPQYRGSDLALYSDIPTVPTKTSDLTNDGNDGTSPFATENFVNSSIATNTAYFRGTYNIVTDLGLTTSASEAQIATAIAAQMTAQSITPTNNDYVFVAYPDATDPTQYDKYDRYKYDSAASEWQYEYTLNNSSFTAAQWAAINSGVTSNNWVSINSAQTISGIKTFSANPVLNNNISLRGKDTNGTVCALISMSAGNNVNINADNIGSTIVGGAGLKPFAALTGAYDLGDTTHLYRDIFFSGKLKSGSNATYGLTLPSTSGWTANRTIATTSDLSDVDGTITATASKNAKRDTSGNLNAVGFNLCTVSTSTANAKMQYNSTNESIEFIFN